MSDRFHLVLGLTGCAQSENAPQWCERVHEVSQKIPLDVVVVSTKGADRFVDFRKIERIFPGRIFRGYDASTSDFPIPHIQIGEWADLVMVYPSSANMLARAAHGFTDELLANIVISTRAPVFFGPTMNDAMYESRAVQANLKKMKSLGYRFVPRETSRVFVHSLGKEVVKPFCSENAVLRCILSEVRKKLAPSKKPVRRRSRKKR